MNMQKSLLAKLKSYLMPFLCKVWFTKIISAGNYSCLAAKFKLHRSVGFHLVQSYIPTILIVIVSWVSFWMDVEHVPGRVALGVTTLLTISSKSAGLSSETPQVSYVKVNLIWYKPIMPEKELVQYSEN